MKELTLREMQLAELDILIEFDRICRENNLTYSLVGGTLLGAVRHKGFIPWDDDIDIAMARPEYEKLYKLITENSDVLPDNLELISDRGENALVPFLKITDKNVTVQSEAGESSDNLWIDIFPIDGYPKDDKKALKFWKKNLRYRRIIFYSYNDGSRKKGWKKTAAKLYGLYARMYGIKRALKNMKRLIAKYPYESSELVGCSCWGMYGLGERLEKAKFEISTAFEFEGRQFMAMSNWHEYLSGIYGDYMQLPPEDKRHTHGVKAFRKDENL